MSILYQRDIAKLKKIVYFNRINREKKMHKKEKISKKFQETNYNIIKYIQCLNFPLCANFLISLKLIFCEQTNNANGKNYADTLNT